MENSEIIDLAVMCMAVDQSPGDEAVAKRFTAALGAAVEEFEQDGGKTKMVITPAVKS